MSKFVTIKTEVRDGAVLEETLRDLGYQYQKGEALRVRGYYAQQQRTAEIVIKREDTGFVGDVGFARNSEKYNVVMDHMDEYRFMPFFNQAYSRRKILKEATRLGFRVTSEQKQADGSLRLVVSRYA